MLAPQLHLFQLRQLAQTGVQNGVSLSLRDREEIDQLGLGLILEPDDTDHLVEVEEDDQQAVQDMEARLDLAETPAGAPLIDLTAMVEESEQRRLQPHDAGCRRLVENVHIDREAILEIAEPEQAFHQMLGLDRP